MAVEASNAVHRVTGCGNLVQVVGPCVQDMPYETGCCSKVCYDALRSMTPACHKKLHLRVCGTLAERYIFAVSERCLGIKPSCRLLEQSVVAPSAGTG